MKKVKHLICFDGKEPETIDYEGLLSSGDTREPEGELNSDDIGEI